MHTPKQIAFEERLREDRQSRKLTPAQLALKARLRAARRRAGLSQVDVAEAIGVSRQAVSLWEGARHRHMPCRENTFALANLFGFSVEELSFEPAPAPEAKQEPPPAPASLPLHTTPSPAVDEALLQEVLEAVLDEARSRGTPVSHDRIARSTATIYEIMRTNDPRAMLPILTAHTLRLAS